FLTIPLALGLLPRPSAAPAPGDPVVLKLATVAPDGSAWMNVLEKMQKEVYLRTRGRVSFKFYPGGIAGEEPTVLEKIRYGQLHGAGLTGIGMGQILPEVRIMELPFSIRTYEEYDYVLERLRPHFEKGFEEKGFVVLAWAEAGFANFFSKKPIRSLEELRSTKVWHRTGDPKIEILFQELGIKPVPVPLSDVLTSIQTGLLETVYVSPLALIALQWFPHLDYAFRTPIYNIQASVVVDRRAWERISPEDRTLVRDLCNANIRGLVESTRKDNAESEQVLRQKGIEFLSPDEAQERAIAEARERIAAAMTGRLFDAALLARFRDLLAEARGPRGAPR
ncbi:MAG TPA: TRAP transporter substrate-binding protein DctP, partial [Planctomycetota bacterium]|nr:TRAP transporter substrate-binding protein DctP [Planctomycetota bacterium]